MNILFNFIKAFQLAYAELKRKKVPIALEKRILSSIYRFYNLNVVLDPVTNQFDLAGYDADLTTLYSITNITSTYNSSGKLVVTITTHRPGMIIGKGGKRLNALQTWLEFDLVTDVKVQLEESKLWKDMYN